MEKFKKHPTNVLRSKGKITRVHALEIARRAMEKGGGEGDMMPLTSAEMPNPMQEGMVPQDPSSQWPAMMAGPQGGLGQANPLAGLLGMGGGGNVPSQ